jgi:hypothetical protein
MSGLSKCLVLVLAILVITQLNLAKADPYILDGFVPPDSLTKPPNVQVHSPQNGSVITSNNVSLVFHVIKPDSPKASQTVLTYIYYETDWLKNTTFLYNYETPEVINGKYVDTGYIETYDYSCNFSNIPDGNHSITIHADGMGWYPPSDGLHYNGFKINGSTTLKFSVDSAVPSISIVNPTNGTVVNAIMGSFGASWQYPANSTFSWVGYSLNGSSWTPGGNHTVTGQNETQLFIGQDGNYTFSLFSNDTAGNWADPQTVNFHIHVVGDALPIDWAAVTALITSIIAIVIVFALALLLLHRRHRNQVKKV